MNAVVEALGEPFYAHCVKAVMDGKDFYDNYNNEPVFYMDDVGQYMSHSLQSKSLML